MAVSRKSDGVDTRTSDSLEERQKSKKTEEIEMIRSFILQHYNQDISLNMIAQNMHMSTSYISRFLKRRLDRTLPNILRKSNFPKPRSC